MDGMEKLKYRIHKFIKKILLEELNFVEEVTFHISSDISIDSHDKISFLCEDKLIGQTQKEELCQIQQDFLKEIISYTELSTLGDLGLVLLKPKTDAEIQTDSVIKISAEVQTDHDIVQEFLTDNISSSNACQNISTQTGSQEQVVHPPELPPSTICSASSPLSTGSNLSNSQQTKNTTELKKLTVDLIPLKIKKEQDDLNYELPEFGETTDEESDNHEVVVLPTPVPPVENDKAESSTRQEELSCPLCPSKFRSQQGSEKHLRIKHDIGNVYICELCQDILPSNTAMHEHMKAKHGVEEIPSQVVQKSTRGRRKSQPRTIRKAKVPPIRKPVSKVKPAAKTDIRNKKSVAIVDKPSISKQKCSYCFKQFTNVKAMQRHMRAAHHSHKCTQCSKSYLSTRALRRHVTTAHQFSRHQCELCGKEFTSKESLYHHKRGLHSDSKPYKCEQCDATFNFNHSLRLHQLKHSGKRPHKCPLCDKSYLTSNHLKMHIEGVHGSKKKYSCKVCGKAFSYTTSLRVHEMAHGNIRPYKCKVCGLGFINSHALKYHSESKHAAGVWFTCDICGKKYKTEFLMKTHRRRHTADGTRFMCDICGHLFMYKSTLEIHAAVHSEEKSFQCSTCGKSFKTYATLYSHQYVHKTEMPFECQECGKAFKTKERCKAHQRRHSGLKPFDCDQCGRCFPDKGGLTKHKKTVHCSEKKHVCSYCGKACSRADNLRVHMKVHEKKNMSSQNLSVSGGKAPTERKNRTLAKVDSRLTGISLEHNVENAFRVDNELDKITSEHGYERLIENLIHRTMDKDAEPKLPYTQTRSTAGGSGPVAPPPTSTTGGESIGTTISSPVALSPPLTRVYTDSSQTYQSESGSHIVPLPIAMATHEGSVPVPPASQAGNTSLPTNHTTAMPLPPPTGPYMYMWPYMPHPNQNTSQSHEGNNFY